METGRKLTPHHSELPHLYGLPQVHEPYTHRQIVRSIVSPYCALMRRYLLKIVLPLSSGSQSVVNNCERVIQSLNCITINGSDVIIFYIISLFTSVLFDRALL